MKHNGKLPKTASLKQIAANRNNARKSTGPKTPEGKAVAKMNAVKHGILARHVVLQGQHDDERAREFQQLYAEYREHFAPVGPLEEMLVERIVTTYWRLQRVLIAERGEITRSVDGDYWRRHDPGRFAFRMRLAALSPVQDMALQLEESSDGLRYLQNMMEEVRVRVEQSGELSDAALQKTHYAGKPNSLTRELEELRTAANANTDGLDAAAAQAKRREVLLAGISRLLLRYKWKLDDCTEREAAEGRAAQAAAHLPSAETLDKIQRYETTLERQLYRAMNQLERLQRRRSGEVIPAPISMEVTH